MFIYGVLVWLASYSVAYAVDTYFPGEGPPTSADVETEKPQYYTPQQAQPNINDEQYNNPGQPINPDETNVTPQPQK
jgi:hypothetical protein